MAATQVEVGAGVPPGTPSSAFFSVPEGEVGQITNAFATMGHSLNPLHMLSLSGLRAIIDDTIQSLKQEIGIATGQQTSWTIIHATTAAQVYTLQQAGLTAYPTKAAAQKKASAQNRNVSKSGKGVDIWNGLDLQQLFLRVGEVLLGIVLLGVGIAHLTGVDNAISNAAKTAGKAAMFA
jgi:hypothetical protein